MNEIAIDATDTAVVAKARFDLRSLLTLHLFVV
jgi:hypothetical protein